MERGVLAGCGVRLEACRGCMPEYLPRERLLRAPLAALELDARLGLLAESLAGLLLAPLEDATPGLERLAFEYRRRVLVEELALLARRLGGILEEPGSRVSPLYAPARRGRLLGPPYSGAALQAMGSPGEYEELARHTGLLEGGRLRPRVALRRLTGLRARLALAARRIGPERLRLLRRAAARILGAARGLEEACPGEPPPHTSYVTLPEGIYLEDPPLAVAEKLLGGPPDCRRPASTSSSLKCRGPRGTIVVKNYRAMLIKWIPAYLASPPESRFLLSPTRRLQNEYTMLRRIRQAAPTPRILAVSHPGTPVMAREYLPGTPVLDMGDPGPWRLMGKTLARIHRAGITLGDPNPGNFLYQPGAETLPVLDAEQASAYTPEKAAWDIAVLYTYARIFNKPPHLPAEAIKAYHEENPQQAKQALQQALNPENTGLLRIITPSIHKELKQLIKQILNN